MGMVSHLPYLLSLSLMQALLGYEQQDPWVERMAASGFRDTSRLAAQDPTMMLDILGTNADLVLESVHRGTIGLGLPGDGLGASRLGFATRTDRRGAPKTYGDVAMKLTIHPPNPPCNGEVS